MFHLSDIAGLSSTIVETVSLDVDDFNESFLTCGTCLCVYDAATHVPKLLPCSHTVCLSCARSIAEAVCDDAARRPQCPICGATFAIPAAGVTALPPSFVVNQLLDLMSFSGRRDVVPKCAQHLNCELLFCETCDSVFCAECDVANGAGVHSSAAGGVLTTSSAAHNVVPFAIAIRRVSEILHYKATQCARNLDAAAVAVEREIRRLDDEADCCVEIVDRTFTDLSAAIEQGQHDVAATIRGLCLDKSQVLQEQLALIDVERDRTEIECRGLPPDVRAITARISKLNELLDGSLFLAEPRENAYIKFDNVGAPMLCDALVRFGAIRTSDTFPALCTVEFEDRDFTVHLSMKASILTYDADGCRRTTGGDPVCVELLNRSRESVPVFVADGGNGTYEISFTPHLAGTHNLTVRIFDRIVGSSSPITFTVNDFHSAVCTFGSLHQPVTVALDGNLAYVLDTGNSRVAVYDIQSGSSTCPIRSIVNDALMQRGATGMCFVPRSGGMSSLFVTNWRTCRVTELTTSGLIVHSFDCPEFVEPTAVTVGRNGEIFIADNAARAIFIFAACGKMLQKIVLQTAATDRSELITCIYAAPTTDELLICDHRVYAISYTGEFQYSLPPGDSTGRGQYGGVVFDAAGRYLASRSERGRAMIQIFDVNRQWMFSIVCSPSVRLRRPSGLVVDDKGHVFVADLGNNCVRVFRYL